jgi:protoporphyrinogen/coproporphyrinogen III oxidase
VTSEVTNWSNNMPNYLISHPKSVEALETELAETYPGILLAGCSYYGVGISDCIGNGESIARKIINFL